MEYIILSADSAPSVHLVPKDVADNLEKYCKRFWEWMATSPYADKHRVDFDGYLGLCYDEHDFIEYLNKWVFPDTPSKLIEKFDDFCKVEDRPDKYRHCKEFNF